MKFIISCEQFGRLANASLKIGESLGNGANGKAFPNRPEFACVRLENRNGKRYAIASNGLIMAIEYLGKTSDENGFICVSNADALVKQCQTEAMFSSDMTVSVDDISGYTVAMTTLGYMYPGDVNTRLGWPRDWRELIVEQPTESDGPLLISGQWLSRLTHAAPSGDFTFPRFTNKHIPTLIRDKIDGNWIGVFLQSKPEVEAQYATLPNWLK